MRVKGTLLLLLWTGSLSPSVFADHEAQEAAHAAVLGALGSTYLSSSLIGAVSSGPTAVAAESVSMAAGISLKLLPPAFNTPHGFEVTPESQGQCTWRLDVPKTDHYYASIYGLPVRDLPRDWGQLGNAELFHFDTPVSMTLRGANLFSTEQPTTFYVPAGNHQFRWRAGTQTNVVTDYLVPTALLAYAGYSKIKAARNAPAAATGDPETAVKAAEAFNEALRKWVLKKRALGWARYSYLLYSEAQGNEPSESALAQLVRNTSDLIGLNGPTPFTFESAVKEHIQDVTVYDLFPPVITYNGVDQVDNAVLPTLVLEATDFGGVARQRVIGEILQRTNAYDPCDRTALLGHDIPDLIRVGQTQVTWSALDSGPTPSGDRHQVGARQTIIVEDTQAPIMITPPGKVIEIDPAEDSVALEEVDLGAPRVVDLADPAPRIYNTAPAVFPIDRRTPVVWTSEDQSGNQSTGEQLITVKATGTNTAPLVADLTLQTLTSEPIDILLSGVDNDELDGVFDPLAIQLESFPQQGEFVAPLLPYFIEDFRTSPAGPFGEDFAIAVANGLGGSWLRENVCANGSPWAQDAEGNSISEPYRIPRNWAYAPEFIDVLDSGEYYLIDRYWRCDSGSPAITIRRISRWSAEHELLGYVGFNDANLNSVSTFLLDRDFVHISSRGSQNFTFRQYHANFQPEDSLADLSADAWSFNTSAFPSGSSYINAWENMRYGRIDYERGILYVADNRRVYVFDVSADLSDGQDRSENQMADRYLGVLNEGAQFLCNDGVNGDITMEVDSQGNLYVADGCDHQLHKFMPSSPDTDGEFVAGDYVGWLGRCDSSTNNACDVENQRSRGYSCTDATCAVETNRSGSDAGQLDDPRFLDLDPNDVLYVADRARVQRFAPDGTYGGQAKSTGTGINQGDNPGFVLGNLGTVKAVTVNATNFYVTDVDESFVHVFATTPLKDITDSSATVTYVSDFAFHGGSDAFTYRATDGLATSNLGTVTIQVDRNFRPPQAFAAEAVTEEDVPLEIALLADDPDGVIGTDDVFPLDQLTYRIVQQPAHGNVSLSGTTATYTPDTDYYGEDAFAFVVNDGVLDSEPAAVQVSINPVDDAPFFREVVLPNRIGRGFPVTMIASYEDDGATAGTVAWVRWGAAYDYQGDFFDPDGEAGPEPPVLQGVKLNEPPDGAGHGNLIADHVFDSIGPVDIQACFFSGQDTPPCQLLTAEVEELVNLHTWMSDSPLETEGNYMDVQLRVENMQPQGWAGLPAANVQLNQVTDPEIVVPGAEISSIVSQSGACVLTSGTLFCSDTSLAPGEFFDATVRVTRTDSSPLIYDLGLPVVFDVTTSSQALEDEYIMLRWLTFTADATDTDMDGMTDVFEQVYELDANNPGDAAADADNDGLSNLEEFEQRTNPRNRDTDGDGIEDPQDYCPLDSDGSIEGQGGLCEAEYRSNPLLRILPLLERL